MYAVGVKKLSVERPRESLLIHSSVKVEIQVVKKMFGMPRSVRVLSTGDGALCTTSH